MKINKSIKLFFIFFVINLLSFEKKYSCGISLVRLKKPIDYYSEKYGDSSWGTKKLLALMERQRNRGQDGAGISVLKFNVPDGHEYFKTLKSVESDALGDVTKQIFKNPSSFIGEIALGHIRYSTHSGLQVAYCQPFLREHYFPESTFAIAGNFNMTNTDYLLKKLKEKGIFFTNKSDTQAILHSIAYNIDTEFNVLDLMDAIKKSSAEWDGGYLFCGVIGNGNIFILRDPAGIRPGYILINDEVMAVASERIALMETFNAKKEDIQQLTPGDIVLIKKNGEILEESFCKKVPETQCSFERIYFSKFNDPDIYQERKALGKNLAQKVLDKIGCNLEKAVFTYVPNSSVCAFLGLIEEVQNLVSQDKRFVSKKVRSEYLIAKNQTVRNFITPEENRKSSVTQLYKMVEGVVGNEDILIVVDDSIVRGTTLRDALIPRLIELNPKKIILVSSCPPIMYPDCYGIDMSQLGKFIAFNAALSLLKEHGKEKILDDINKLCLAQKDLPINLVQNFVSHIYNQFTTEELLKKIAQLVTPSNSKWQGSIEVIYQDLNGLHNAIPNFTGDWYFSGNYPTPGGFKVLNNSYIKWYVGDDSRSY